MSQDQDSKEEAPEKPSAAKIAPEEQQAKPQERAKQREKGVDDPKRAIDEKREADELERKIARLLSMGIPIGSVIGFVVVSVLTNLSLGLLVLAGGAMLGTISLFWSSVRTLGGDAPLPEGLAARVFANEVDALEEEKRATLRILKDLEHERAVGKIDEFDYAELVKHYRANAMALMQALDARGEVFSGDLKKHLANLFPRDTLTLLVGEDLASGEEPKDESDSSKKEPADNEPQAVTGRVDCSSCKTPNEPDAVFCKSCGAKMGNESPRPEETGGAS